VTYITQIGVNFSERPWNTENRFFQWQFFFNARVVIHLEKVHIAYSYVLEGFFSFLLSGYATKYMEVKPCGTG
jgi:hypothetical protein